MALGQDSALKLPIHRLLCSGLFHQSAKVFVAHGHGTVHQISQRVGQIPVGAFNKQLPGDGTVVFKGHLVKKEIAHGVYAYHLYQLIGIQHVALALAHLSIAHKQPGVAENLLGKGQIQRHKKDGPVKGMEANDILSDQMQIGRPIFFIILPVVPVHVIA